MSMRQDLNRSRPTDRRQRWSGDGGRRPSAAANAACCAKRGERTVARGRHPEHRAILGATGMQTLIDVVLHIDVHLDAAIQQYGTWTYALLFAVIFAETGLVATPFLPGDSLLFAAGTFAARGSLHLGTVVAVLTVAAVAGDTANYWIGSAVRSRVREGSRVRFLKPDSLDRTHRFYERYGSFTIVLARFVPIVRTLAPFVAGVGRMTYWRFLIYNIGGAVLWVVLLVAGGYLLGNLPFIRRRFTLAIVGIILVSVLPAVLEIVRHRRRAKVSR